MAIKIVLTDEDALAWVSHVAKIGEPAPDKRGDGPPPPAPEPEKRGPGRPRRAPIPQAEAGPVIELAAEAVTDADPLLDGGSSPKQNETFSEPVAVPAGVGDDLDLGDGLLTALVEYSDAEMAAAAVKFVTAKREPGNRTFRLILGKYATQVADIPQDRRQSFLDELKAAT